MRSAKWKALAAAIGVAVVALAATVGYAAGQSPPAVSVGTSRSAAGERLPDSNAEVLRRLADLQRGQATLADRVSSLENEPVTAPVVAEARVAPADAGSPAPRPAEMTPTEIEFLTRKLDEDPSDPDWGGPSVLAIDEVARKHPNVKLLLATCKLNMCRIEIRHRAGDNWAENFLRWLPGGTGDLRYVGVPEPDGYVRRTFFMMRKQGPSLPRADGE